MGDELALDFAYRRLNPIWYRVALADREMAAFGIDVGPAPIPIRVGSDASVVLDDMKVATYPEWICRAHDRGVHLFFDAHSGLETDLDTLLARSDGRVLFAIGKLVTEPDHSL